MEEDRVVKEANQQAKLAAEIAQWQRETQENQKNTTKLTGVHETLSNFDAVSSDTRVDHKLKEPLITKAYNAFRETNTNQTKPFEAENLIPTDAYIDERHKATFRDTTMSGLRHAQNLLDTAQNAGGSTAGDGQSDLYGNTILPPIQQPRMGSTGQSNMPAELQ